MAQILSGPSAAEARGSAGGTTYSRNRYGAYIRNRSIPVQPRTPRQVAQRARFTAASQRWKTVLTSTMRESWEQYALTTPTTTKLGKRKELPGNAMYCGFNSMWFGFMGAYVDTAPTTPGEAAMIEATLTGTVAEGVKLTAVNPALAVTDILLVLKCAAPLSQARNFFNGPWTLCTFEPGSVALPWILIAPAQCAIGQRWYFQFRLFTADGRRGPTSRFRRDILA